MKKIVVFGATGTIGKHLVSQALEAGHQVTAFTRDKNKLAVKHENLQVREGDVFNSGSVEAAVEGQDIVMIALGAGRKGGVRSEGTRVIIGAMEKLGVDRLICQTTLGAGDSVGNLNFFWKRIMFGWFLKKAFEDHQIQERHIYESKLDWTIVRPAAFTDGEKTGNYKHGFPATDKGITAKISRADVAEFMLKQIGSVKYLRKTPGLSY